MKKSLFQQSDLIKEDSYLDVLDIIENFKIV